MSATQYRRSPGEVRDAVRRVLHAHPSGASVGEIVGGVRDLIGDVSGSSIRSYLRLNTPRSFIRPRRGYYRLADGEDAPDNDRPAKCRFRTTTFGRATVIHADCMEWLVQQERSSVHAVVTRTRRMVLSNTRPRSRRSFATAQGECGASHRRSMASSGHLCLVSPCSLPTTCGLSASFSHVGHGSLTPVLVPGANVVVAANPLLSYVVAGAFAERGA